MAVEFEITDLRKLFWWIGYLNMSARARVLVFEGEGKSVRVSVKTTFGALY